MNEYEIEMERAVFEEWALSMGFDLTRYRCAAPEMWSEYQDHRTGLLWAGWIGRADFD